MIPTLEYYYSADHFYYRWSNCVTDFKMPVRCSFNNKKESWIYPSTEWKDLKLKESKLNNKFNVNRNFYIDTKEVIKP